MRLQSGPTLALMAFALFAGSCTAPDDLDTALDAGVGRIVTEPVAAADREMSWITLQSRGSLSATEESLPSPQAVCWIGADLYVGDAQSDRVEVFDANGQHLFGFGGTGSGPGEFQGILDVDCAPDGAQLMIADGTAKRLSFFSPEGDYLSQLVTPGTPHGYPPAGAYALANDGWLDSWLGANVGPYLEDSEWEAMSAVRAWTLDGTPVGEFGRTDEYENGAVRRVFNHVTLAVHDDTVWVLIKGSSKLVRYTMDGEMVGSPLFLPVYFRGEEPWVQIGLPNGPIRQNRAVYQPNIATFTVLPDSRIALVRHVDWRWIDNRTNYWSDSIIEILTPDGTVVERWNTPGRVTAIQANQNGRVAVISVDEDTRVRSVSISR